MTVLDGETPEELLCAVLAATLLKSKKSELHIDMRDLRKALRQRRVFTMTESLDGSEVKVRLMDR